MKNVIVSLIVCCAAILCGADIVCEGVYAGHLQGVDADAGAIYWSFTGDLVKTDHHGKKLLSIPVPRHHGDLCVHQGKLYVAVCLGKFNRENPKGKNFVYCYDAATLKLEHRFPVDEMIYGAGGMTFNGTNFLVVGGLPDTEKENLAAEYTPEFKLVRVIRFPWRSKMGIQTAYFMDGKYVFGVYDRIPTKICNPEMKVLKDSRVSTNVGFVRFPDGRTAAARTSHSKSKGKGGCGGVLNFYTLTPDNRLVRPAENH